MRRLVKFPLFFISIFFLFPHLAKASDIRAYIPAYTSGNVSIINTTNNTVGPAAITADSGAQGVAYTPDGAFVYVTNQVGNDITKIDTATNTVVDTISVIDGPLGVAVSPDGQWLYVSCILSNDVHVFDVGTDAPVGSPIGAGCSVPRGIVFSPDSAFAYVGCGAISKVMVVDTSNQSVVGSLISVNSGPVGLAMSPDGAFVFAADVSSNKVSVIDTNTKTEIATVDVGGEPIALVVTPDGKYVYVSNNATGDNTVSVIDTSSLNVLPAIAVGHKPYGISVTPDGAFVYVVNEGDNTVTPINTQTFEAGTAITLPDANNPIGLGNFITPSAVVHLDPDTYVFPDQEVNTSSDAISFQLTNPGTAVLNIDHIEVSGDFSQTNDCGSTLNTAQACTIQVTFTPTASGTREGSITITDNVIDLNNANITPSPQVFVLSGSGIAAPTPPPVPPTPSPSGRLQGACALQANAQDHFSFGFLMLGFYFILSLRIFHAFQDSFKRCR